MGFRLQHKLMTLNDLVVSFMRVVTKWLKLESCDFHCTIALYHSYLPVKFDDDIQGGPLIWGIKIRWGGFKLRGSVS